MNLDSFMQDSNEEEISRETRNRIRLSVFAYAYEFEDNPLVDDGAFDELCGQINLDMSTRRPDLDDYFRREFNPSTGMWIRVHPELDKIKHIYERYYKR